MDIGRKLLSDITVYSKYARYNRDLQRRETWTEIVDRTMLMHCKKYPRIAKDIEQVFEKYVHPKLVLPSMRGLQFAGKPVELMPNRIMNCAAMPISHPKAFRELMFLLLGGTGVGFSVQYNHIKHLPCIKKPIGTVRYVVQDSIIGWSDAVHVLVESYFTGSPRPLFDFSDVRPRGTPLKTAGGKAPGSEELEKSLASIEDILNSVVYGEQLSSLQCHDMCCHIASAVLSGGIRRAAMLSLFDFDDQQMINCKSGDWFEDAKHRQYSNNSAMTLRYKLRKKELLSYIEKIKSTGFGEPGLYLANDYNSLTNPCAEASVSMNFCNLTTFNMSEVESNKDLKEFAKAAAFIGTLQAGYTNYHYLRPEWREKTEKEALLGVSCTGVARKDLTSFDFKGAAQTVIKQNEYMAQKIGINSAYRCTVNKPEGTSSAVLGCSSGIHSWHGKQGVRRTRYMHDEPILKYLEQQLPDLVETDQFSELRKVLSLPFQAPEQGVTREDETCFDQLERVKFMSENWVQPGHVKGHNGHSVSATISVKDNEWDDLAEWMWKDRDAYNGLSILPYDGGNYVQAPFEATDQETVEKMLDIVRASDVNLKDVKEEEDLTQHTQEPACQGGACEI